MLERRGLRHREWAVEWESSALEFLLDKGFSPAMGARPLKRAIDQHLLAPLAATMVEHRFPEGDQFLFVRSDGRAIQVEFVDPDAPADSAPRSEPDPQPAGAAASVPRMMVMPAGSAAEAARSCGSPARREELAGPTLAGARRPNWRSGCSAPTSGISPTGRILSRFESWTASRPPSVLPPVCPPAGSLDRRVRTIHGPRRPTRSQLLSFITGSTTSVERAGRGRSCGAAGPRS